MKIRFGIKGQESILQRHILRFNFLSGERGRMRMWMRMRMSVR